MMRFARERSIILLEMYIEPDVFERFNIRQRMTGEAINFVSARSDYEKTNITAEEKQLFDEIFEIVAVTAPIQVEAAEFMIADEMDKANKLLFGDALPNQALIMKKFNDLLHLVEKETDKEVSNMESLLDENNTNVLFLIILVISGTLISFLLIIVHSRKRERELQKLVNERTHELENAHIRTKSLVKNASDGIVTIDDKQNIVMFNPAAEKMFEYTKDDASGKPLSILLPNNLRNSHSGLVESFALDGSVQSRMMDARLPVLGMRKDGSSFPAEVSICKYRLDNKMYFTAFIRDVTEKREAEDKLLKYQEKLEELVKERTLELEQARDEAQRASQVKSEFLSVMSHEMRTPMNAIIGFTELVLLNKDLSNRNQKNIQSAHDSAIILLTIINDVLDLTKIEQGKLELEKIDFDLPNLLKDTIEILNLEAQKKSLYLNLSISESVAKKVIGDPTKFRQVMINLVGNALKFTNKGGVKINVGSEEPSKLIHIEIKDTGIGIPKDQIEKIFDPFTQADFSTTRKFGGTGLGTYISKNIVEMMNGKIEVESVVGEGSTFHVSVNLPPAS